MGFGVGGFKLGSLTKVQSPKKGKLKGLGFFVVGCGGRNVRVIVNNATRL